MKLGRMLLAIALIAALVMPATALAQFGKFKLDDVTDSKPKIAVFKIKQMVETPQNIPPLFGEKPPESTKSMLERLKKARTDNDVVAVVLDVEGAQLGFAQTQELFDAIKQFKAVDKPVYVHADSLATRNLALASAGSHISMTPTGDVWLLGLYGASPYFKDMLAKMDMKADFLHCGAYKSAHEPFTRSGPSPEAQEMMDWLLDGLFESLIGMIAEGRGMTPEKVHKLLDRGLFSAEDAKDARLIDAVQYKQDFIAEIEKRHGDVKFVLNYASEDPLSDVPEDFFGMMNFMMQMLFEGGQEKSYSDPSIAIVYVEGMILTGSAQTSPFGTTSGAYSTTIRKALDKAADEDSVKAVVLRIDSGGGSALASEIILDASRRVAARKPLIVSMGNVAGSGGYYVACAAETIFADPATITGSIGVVGGKIVTRGGWQKIGVNWSENKRGKMAGIMSTDHAFTPEERERLGGWMNEIYGVFKDHVVAIRGEKLAKPIDEMAGGRVYTGKQALELGLVDRMGGMTDAVRYAAERAGLGDYELRVIPEPPTIFDMFAVETKEEYTVVPFRGSLGLLDSPFVKAALRTLEPQRADAILSALKGLELINREGVVMMMPAPLVIE